MSSPCFIPKSLLSLDVCCFGVLSIFESMFTSSANWVVASGLSIDVSCLAFSDSLAKLLLASILLNIASDITLSVKASIPTLPPSVFLTASGLKPNILSCMFSKVLSPCSWLVWFFLTYFWIEPSLFVIASKSGLLFLGSLIKLLNSSWVLISLGTRFCIFSNNVSLPRESLVVFPSFFVSSPPGLIFTPFLFFKTSLDKKSTNFQACSAVSIPKFSESSFSIKFPKNDLTSTEKLDKKLISSSCIICLFFASPIMLKSSSALSGLLSYLLSLFFI